MSLAARRLKVDEVNASRARPDLAVSGKMVKSISETNLPAFDSSSTPITPLHDETDDSSTLSKDHKQASIPWSSSSTSDSTKPPIPSVIQTFNEFVPSPPHESSLTHQDSVPVIDTPSIAELSVSPHETDITPSAPQEQKEDEEDEDDLR